MRIHTLRYMGYFALSLAILVVSSPGAEDDHSFGPEREAKEFRFLGFHELPTEKELQVPTIEKNVLKVLEAHENLRQLQQEFDSFMAPHKDDYWGREGKCRDFYSKGFEKKILDRFETFFDQNAKALQSDESVSEWDRKQWFRSTPPRLADETSQWGKPNRHGTYTACGGGPLNSIWRTVQHAFQQYLASAQEAGVKLEELSGAAIYLGIPTKKGTPAPLVARGLKALDLKADLPSRERVEWEAWKAASAGQTQRAHDLLWSVSGTTRGEKIGPNQYQTRGLGASVGSDHVPELRLDPNAVIAELKEDFGPLGADYFRASLDWVSGNTAEGIHQELWEREKSFYRVIDRLHQTKHSADQQPWARAVAKRCELHPDGGTNLTGPEIDKVASCVLKKFTDSARQALAESEAIVRKKAGVGSKAVLSSAMRNKVSEAIPPGVLALLERTHSTPALSRYIAALNDLDTVPKLRSDALEDLQRAGDPNNTMGIVGIRPDFDASILEWVNSQLGNSELSAHNIESLFLFRDALKERRDRSTAWKTDELIPAGRRGVEPKSRLARVQKNQVVSSIPLPKAPLLVPTSQRIPYTEFHHSDPDVSPLLKQPLPADSQAMCKIAEEFGTPGFGVLDAEKEIRKQLAKSEIQVAYAKFSAAYPDLADGKEGPDVRAKREALAKVVFKEAEPLLKQPYAQLIEKYYGLKWDEVTGTLYDQEKNLLGLALMVKALLRDLSHREYAAHAQQVNWCVATRYLKKSFETVQGQLEILGEIQEDSSGSENAKALLRLKYRDFLLSETGDDLDELFKNGTSVPEVKRRIARVLLEKYANGYRGLELQSHALLPDHNVEEGEKKKMGEQHFPLDHIALVVRARQALGLDFPYPQKFQFRLRKLLSQGHVDTTLLDPLFRGELNPAQKAALLLTLEEASNRSKKTDVPELKTVVGLLLSLVSEGSHDGLDRVANGSNRRFRSDEASKVADQRLATQFENAPPVTTPLGICSPSEENLSEWMKTEDSNLEAAIFGKDPKETLDFYLSGEEIDLDLFIEEAVRNTVEKYRELNRAYYNTLRREGALEDLVRRNRQLGDSSELELLYNALKDRGRLPKTLTLAMAKKMPALLAPHAGPYLRHLLLSRFVETVSSKPIVPSVVPKLPEPSGGKRLEAMAARVVSLRQLARDTQQRLSALRSADGMEALYLGQDDNSALFQQDQDAFRRKLNGAFTQVLESFDAQYSALTDGMDVRDQLALPPDVLLLSDRSARFRYAFLQSEKGRLQRAATTTAELIKDAEQTQRYAIYAFNNAVGSQEPARLKLNAAEEELKRLLQVKKDQEAAWKAHEVAMKPALSQQKFLGQLQNRLRLLPREMTEAHTLADQIQNYLTGVQSSFPIKPDPLLQMQAKLAQFCQTSPTVCRGSARFADLKEQLALLHALSQSQFAPLETGPYEDYFSRYPSPLHPFGSDNAAYFSPCAKLALGEALRTQRQLASPVPPAVAEKPQTTPEGPLSTLPTALSWNRPESFLPGGTSTDRKSFLNTTTPFVKVPPGPGRDVAVALNQRLLAEALDLLSDPTANALQIRKSFAAYAKARLGLVLPSTPDRTQLKKVRLALIADVWAATFETAGPAEQGRMTAALRRLPPEVGEKTFAGLETYLAPKPGERKDALPHKDASVQAWVRRMGETQPIREDSSMELLAMLAASIDDHWTKRGTGDHAQDGVRLAAEIAQRQRHPERARLLESLVESVAERGSLFTSESQRWVLNSEDVAGKIQELNRFFVTPWSGKHTSEHRGASAFFEVLTSENSDQKTKLTELYRRWGQFALKALPELKDFANQAEFETAMRAVLKENREQLLEMVRRLDHDHYSYAEVQQLLGDYLLRTRGFTPYQMVAVVDPELNVHSSQGPERALTRPFDAVHAHAIKTQLLMDVLDLGKVLRRPTPLVARTDLAGAHPAFGVLSRDIESGLGDGKLELIALLRTLVPKKMSVEEWKAVLSKAMPYLDSYGIDRLARSLDAVSQIPKEPTEEQYFELLVNRLWGLPTNTTRKDLTASASKDLDGLLNAVRTLHAVLLGEGELGEEAKRQASQAMTKLALSDHPSLAFNVEALAYLLGQSPQSPNLLTRLPEFQNLFASSEEAKQWVNSVSSVAAFRQFGAQSPAEMAAVIRAAGWVEGVMASGTKVTPETVERLVALSVYGIAPGQTIPPSQTKAIADSVRWVRLALMMGNGKGEKKAGPETQLAAQIVPQLGSGRDKSGLLGMIRSTTAYTPSETSLQETLKAEMPYLDEFQNNRLAKVLRLVSQLPENQLPSDEILRQRVSEEVFSTGMDIGVLKDDIAQIARVVKGLHGLAHGDGALGPVDRTMAASWLTQAAMSDHPTYALSQRWGTRLLQENELASDLLEDFEKYEGAFVSVSEIEALLRKTTAPGLLDEMTEKEISDLANVLRAARWVEEEWAEKGREKVSDEEIERLVALSIFGISPKDPIPLDQVGPVKEKTKMVRFALALLTDAPSPDDRGEFIRGYVKAHLVEANAVPAVAEIAERDGFVLNEFLRLVRLFSPPGSARAGYVKEEERKVQELFLDSWTRAILADKTHLGGILPQRQNQMLAAKAESRDELLHRISRVQRRLADDPPPIDLNPVISHSGIIVGMDRVSSTHRVDGFSKFLKDLLEETDPDEFRHLLEQPTPITVKDLTFEYRLDRAHSIPVEDQVYAPAMATFRCRLFSAMQGLLKGSQVDPHSPLVSSSLVNTPVKRRRAVLVLAKVVKDIEVMMMAPYSDTDGGVKAHRELLRALDVVDYAKLLEDRLVLSERGIPGCTYKSRTETRLDGRETTEPSSELAWDEDPSSLERWSVGVDGILQPPREITDDNAFLALLNGQTIHDFRGDRVFPPRMTPEWQQRKSNPAFEAYSTYRSFNGRGYPRDHLMPPSKEWAESVLAKLPEKERGILQARLDLVEAEATKSLDRLYKKIKPLRTPVGEVWGKYEEDIANHAWEQLQTASHAREAIYRDIAAAHNREHVTTPTFLPAFSEQRLLALPDHLRTLVYLITRRNRQKAEQLRRQIYRTTDEETLGHLRKEERRLHVEANSLLLNPDLAALLSTGWSDPQIRSQLLSLITYSGRWFQDEMKGLRELEASLRRIDPLLLKDGEKVLSLEEREGLRDQFLAVFELMDKPGRRERELLELGSSEAGDLAERRRKGARFLALVFRMTEEASAIRYGQSHSDFAQTYEAVMGGDKRFSPEVTLGELKHEREVSKICAPKEGEKLSEDCQQLQAHIAKRYRLGRAVSTHTRLRFLDAKGPEKLTTEDYAQWKRLEDVVLGNLITHSEGEDPREMVRELLNAVPHPAVIDQISQKFDTARYLYAELEEKTPRLSEDLVDEMVKAAKSGKVTAISIGPNQSGALRATRVERSCGALQAGEAVADLDTGSLEQMQGKLVELGRVSAYQKALERFKKIHQREPSFEELAGRIQVKVPPPPQGRQEGIIYISDEVEEAIQVLRLRAAKKYMAEAVKTVRNAEEMDILLKDPTSSHGCAMRALVGPATFASANREFMAIALDVVEDKTNTVLHMGPNSTLPKLSQAQSDIFDRQMEELLHSPALPSQLEIEFAHAISDTHPKNAEGEKAPDWERLSPEHAIAARLVREKIADCAALPKILPRLLRPESELVTELAHLLGEEELSLRALHQSVQVETQLTRKEADLQWSPIALDLRFFTDPETGRVPLSKKQLKLFEDPEKNPMINDEHMKKSIAQMREDLESYENKAASLKQEQARLRLRLEAMTGAPIDGDFFQEELQANRDVISRVEGLINEEIQRRTKALDEKDRPAFPAFVGFDFLHALENDKKIQELVHAFNEKKMQAMQDKRDKYQLPEGFDPRHHIGEMDQVKVRSLLMRGAALARMKRQEELREKLATAAIADDQRVARQVEEDFNALAAECVKQNAPSYGMTKKNGTEIRSEDIRLVADELKSWRAAQDQLKTVMASLVPAAGVDVGPMDKQKLFETYIAGNPSYLTALHEVQGTDAVVRLDFRQEKELHDRLLTEVFDERQKDAATIQTALAGLGELGFHWDGAGLNWENDFENGLSLHLIGRKGTKIKSVAELRAALESLKNVGIYRQNGIDPWDLFLNDLWSSYATGGFRPFFEFGKSAVCMADFFEKNSVRKDDYYNFNGTPDLLDRKGEHLESATKLDEATYLGDDLSDGNVQAARLCLMNQARLKDGKRLMRSSAPSVYHEGEPMPENFLNNFQNGERYLSFMDLASARSYVQGVHDRVRSNVAGEGSDYYTAVMDVRGQSTNLWAAFDLTEINWTGEFNLLTLDFAKWKFGYDVNGMATRLTRASDLLNEEHRKLQVGIAQLRQFGGIQIQVDSNGGGTEQPVATVAESYRQQQKYLMDPEMFRHLPREVMDNINNQEQFLKEEVYWELGTLGAAGVLRLGTIGLRASRLAKSARYARWAVGAEKALHLGHHMVKGGRDAYRFGLGGKMFSDAAISNWGYFTGERGYVITQPLDPVHTRRSAWVFALLPVATPAVTKLAQLGGVPARLIPWVANPLAMGGTHYGVELAHGADPRHALVGSVPMFLFGLPAAKFLGKGMGKWMKSSYGGVLRSAAVRSSLAYMGNHIYFASVTGTGALLQHYFTPEVYRDPETGEAVYRDPRNGKVIEDAGIWDIVSTSVIANIGMDAFFARNHVRETQAHAAGYLIRSGEPYRSVIEMFAGKDPTAQANAHHLVMEGLAQISVSEFRTLMEERANLELALQKDPTSSVSRTELDRVNQTLALIASGAGFGKGEPGVYDHAAVAEYAKRLEAHTSGKKGNRLLGELNDRIAFDTAFAQIEALAKQEGGGTPEEWATLVEDPAFQGAGASMPYRLSALPAEKVTEALRDPALRPKFEALVSNLAGALQMPGEISKGLEEYLANYHPKKGETLFQIASGYQGMWYRMRLSQKDDGTGLIRQMWRLRNHDLVEIGRGLGEPRAPELVAEGRMELEGLSNLARQMPEVLGDLRLADIHVLQRKAQGEGVEAAHAKLLLEMAAARVGMTPEAFGHGVESVSRTEPATAVDAQFGKNEGLFLHEFESRLVPKAVQEMVDKVGRKEMTLTALLEALGQMKDTHFEVVPASGYELEGTKLNEIHLSYLLWASGTHLDNSVAVKRFLTERGIGFKEYQRYLVEYVRMKGKDHPNLKEALSAATGAFMTAKRDAKEVGEMDIAEFEAFDKALRSVSARLTANPKDAEALAEWETLWPQLYALGEYTGIKDFEGNPDAERISSYLGLAKLRRKDAGASESNFPIRELLYEASRMARQDMATQVRIGKIPIGAILDHDLFTLRWTGSVAEGTNRYSTEAAAAIPQDLLVKAFQDAEPGPGKVRLAQAIVAVSQASGYTERQSGMEFLHFVEHYRGEGKTVAELSRLFLKGTPAELASLIVAGHLDIDGLNALPERWGAQTMRDFARSVGRDPASSRGEAVLMGFKVGQLRTLMKHFKDVDHPNHVNAVKTLTLLSNWLGTKPAALMTFLEGYGNPAEGRGLAGFFGWGAGGVESRTMQRVSEDFWETHEETIRTTLTKDPRLVDRMIDSGFFEDGRHYGYIPTQSLILKTGKYKVTEAGNEETRTLFQRPTHLALVQKAGEDAFKDPIFGKRVEKLPIPKEKVVREFVDFLIEKIKEDPSRHPDLESYIEAIKLEFVEGRTTTGWLWPTLSWSCRAA